MPTTVRPLRADAERNRRLLLEAAGELFAERGLHVSLDDIAKRAGVGVGTAYRRFGSRTELVAALFEERVEQMVALAEDGLAAEDPWEGLVSFIERSSELQASDRGLKEILLGSAEGRERIASVRDRMRPLSSELVRRAQETGALRSDFAAQDLPMLQIMLGAIVDASISVEPDLWRRYLSLLVAGMRSEAKPGGGAELARPAVGWGGVRDVLSSWRPPRRD